MFNKRACLPLLASRITVILLGGTLSTGFSMPAFANSANVASLRARYGDDLLLVAPLSSINRTMHTAEAIGQTIRLPQSGTQAAADLLPSQLVAVTGRLDPDGVIDAVSVYPIPEDAVDGATELMVTGKVTKVHAEIGTATLGNLKVNYAGALHAGPIQMSPDDVTQLVGVSYTQARLFVANDIVSIAHSSVAPNDSSAAIPSHSVTLTSKGGSMGSGRTLGGSMGSGSTNKLSGGSMGSGSPTPIAKGGSMGSGRAFGGSMGSGGAQTLAGGSMGSGSPGAVAKGGSMGSGRAFGGSMGSGGAQTLAGGSMGSGSPSAVAKGGSMGSGRALGGSMGSGKAALTGGSMGSGSKANSP